MHGFNGRLLAALTRLEQHGLDGGSTDDAIAIALADADDIATLSADRDRVRDSGIDITAATFTSASTVPTRTSILTLQGGAGARPCALDRKSVV